MSEPEGSRKNKSSLSTDLAHLYQFKLPLLLKSLLIGVLTGLLIVTFRLLLHQTEAWRFDILNRLRYAGFPAYLLWTFLLIAVGLLLGLAVHYFPLVRGSGIPQVKGVMVRQLEMKWFPEILVKFFGGLTALGFGMSMGREGPSIQLGSFVGEGILSFSKKPHLERKFLITSGAAAGLAAAFNAPLAGVIFVLEELHKTISPLMLMCAMGASVAADLVAGQFFGLKPIFDFHTIDLLPLRYYPHILVLGVIIAFSGDLFKRLLYLGQDLYVKLRIPRVLRPLAPLILSFFIGMQFFEITGGGHEMIESLVMDISAPLQTLILLLVMKVLLTVFCYGSGTPGGIFLPLLLIGALTGHIYGCFLVDLGFIEPHYILNLMVLGMAAQFTSIVRAPVTGSILILEMCGNLNHLSGIVWVCLVSYAVSELLKSRPVYDVLLERLIQRNPTIVQDDSRKVILEIPVSVHSFLEHKKIREIPWPEDTLVVGIRRGEQDQIPKGSTEIVPGDLLLILVSESRAAEVKMPLLAMGTESDTRETNHHDKRTVR